MKLRSVETLLLVSPAECQLRGPDYLTVSVAATDHTRALANADALLRVLRDRGLERRMRDRKIGE